MSPPAPIDLVREQGYEMTDVPPRGEMVKLALTGNMSTGGISIDRTFEAHPDNIDIAEEAARVVGLDIAGIDFLCPDITQPVRETGGAICEVNAAPGFRMHSHPTIGDPQYVAKPVVDLMFPPGTSARIPIVAVTGTNGKTTCSRMIGHIFKGMGRKVGMTSTDGIVIDDRLVIKSDASGPRSARMVLQNPRVDFAVFEVARGGILREGLGYSRNDVAVVLNVAPDHLGLRGINTVEQLAQVKQVIVEAVPKNGAAVLNADDPLVAEMRRASSGEVVWFSIMPDNRMISDHCRRGGKAVILEPSELGDLIVLVHGRRRMPIAYTHLLPATFGGKAMFNVQNAMAAAGAAYCAGAHLQRHPGRAAIVHPVVLLRSRPDEHDRGQGHQGHRRLLPQRSGHDRARRVRRPVLRGQRVLGAAAADRRHRHRRRPPGSGHDRSRTGVGQAFRPDHRPGGRTAPRPGAGGDGRADRAGREASAGGGRQGQADRGGARRDRGHQGRRRVGQSW